MWTSRALEARAREVGVDSLEVGVLMVWWPGCDEDEGNEEEDDDGCEPFSLSSSGCLLRIAWRGCGDVFVRACWGRWMGECDRKGGKRKGGKRKGGQAGGGQGRGWGTY